MKKILGIIIILLFFCSLANCEELQLKYEQANSKKYKIFKRHNVSYILKKDLRNYKSGKKSTLGQLLLLYDNSDEANYDYLLKIKNNFMHCSQNVKCWINIEVDDYRYRWLDEATKDIILFNNMVYIYK